MPISILPARSFRIIVGDDRVVTAEDRLASYFDPYSPGLADEYAPSGAVLPASVDEVKACSASPVATACRCGPSRSAATMPMAAPRPCLKGSMILDLNRMRAIEVNAELAYAVVEAGVTYLDLYKFIRDKNYPLWIDCPDPG